MDAALCLDKDISDVDEDHNIRFGPLHLERGKPVVFDGLVSLFVEIWGGGRSLERWRLLGGEGRVNLGDTVDPYLFRSSS